MLTKTQRSALFVLFCAFVSILVSLEAFLVYSIIANGFSSVKLVTAAFNTGILYGLGVLFKEMVTKTFLKSSFMPPDRLHRSASERNNIIQQALQSGEDIYTTRSKLISNTLKFSEECLRGWVPGSHFELCVFVDQNQPLLFAYFDSNHDVRARSMVERETNPRFYLDRGYEVTKLLQSPTSHPRVLSNTLDPKSDYAFTSTVQRKQIVSSILLCLDLAMPCALVVSSNEKNAFPENDPDVISFIKYIGATVRCDLVDGGFLADIRSLKPELFA